MGRADFCGIKWAMTIFSHLKETSSTKVSEEASFLFSNLGQLQFYFFGYKAGKAKYKVLIVKITRQVLGFEYFVIRMPEYLFLCMLTLSDLFHGGKSA